MFLFLHFHTAMKIIFATNNQHKLNEVRQIAGPRFELVSLEDIALTGDIPEESDTLEGNALGKARYIFDRTGLPTFADDTGLEVEALEGRPGVLSARYAGEGKNDQDNMNKILHELKNKTNRKARFRTVIAFIPAEGKELFFEGIINGEIGTEPKGNHGFGYDPVFIPEGYDISFAEMEAGLKNRISHRSRAFAKFATYLQKNFNNIP